MNENNQYSYLISCCINGVKYEIPFGDFTDLRHFSDYNFLLKYIANIIQVWTKLDPDTFVKEKTLFANNITFSISETGNKTEIKDFKNQTVQLYPTIA